MELAGPPPQNQYKNQHFSHEITAPRHWTKSPTQKKSPKQQHEIISCEKQSSQGTGWTPAQKTIEHNRKTSFFTKRKDLHRGLAESPPQQIIWNNKKSMILHDTRGQGMTARPKTQCEATKNSFCSIENLTMGWGQTPDPPKNTETTQNCHIAKKKLAQRTGPNALPKRNLPTEGSEDTFRGGA